MAPPGLTLVTVDARTHATTMTSIHAVTATAAYGHIFDSPFPTEAALTRWSEHAGRVVLALCGGVAVGFAAASADGTLEGLYVLPDESGRGIGTALLRAVAPVSRLWVLEDNASARAFYEARAWRWSGVRQQADDAAEGVTELLYVPAQDRLDVVENEL